jgi:glycosyltransferase involved in cell wall biosynthesis
MSDYFFTRGDGPLVSVLLPSRGRPEGLCRCIDSLYSLARDKSCLEFILKLDDDDKKTIEVYEKMKGMVNIRAEISPRGKGYLQMHEWVNRLALQAKGDWLIIWNDDAVLAGDEDIPSGIPGSQNWDDRLLNASFNPDASWHGCPDICSLITPTIGRPEASEFFFVRRKVVEVLGHFALNPHNDNYLQTVLCFTSSSFRFPIYIHHGSNENKDKVREEVLEAYKVAGKDLNTLNCMRDRMEDVKKTVDYIEQWRRKRCTACLKFLTETPWMPSLKNEYLIGASGCKHGFYLICKGCADQNKIGKCPVCDLKEMVYVEGQSEQQETDNKKIEQNSKDTENQGNSKDIQFIY